MRPEGDTGVQTHFNAVYQFLRGHHVPVSLLTPFSAPKALIYPLFGPRSLIDRVNGTASVWWYEYWHYQVLRGLLRRALASGPAVVYAQCPLSARAALETRTSPDQKVIMVVHFNVSQADEWANKGLINEHGRLHRAIRRREQEILPRLDGLVYLSAFMKTQLIRRIPELDRVRSMLVPHLLKDVAQGPPSRPRRDVINLGGLDSRKNQQFLLRVLAAANQLGKRYTLTLVGEGAQRKTLESLIVELGLQSQVELAGRVPGGARLLGEHRVYCHSAVVENMPLALIEALSYGRPILAAPVGGVPEIFSDGVEGYYWDLDDPAAGAAKLVQLIEDPVTWQRMSAAARTRFVGNFEQNAVGARWLEFLTGDQAG